MSWGTPRSRYEEILLHEHENAWVHYRHLEASRSQYLGFLFTITFAALAYAGTIHGVFEKPWRAVGLSGVMFLVTILALFILINVKKLGVALEHFRNVAIEIRDEFLGPDPSLRALLLPEKPAARNRILRSALFTVQGTSELVPLVFSLIAAGGQVVLAVHGSLEATPPGPRVLLLVLGAASALFVIAVLAVGDRPYWVDEAPETQA